MQIVRNTKTGFEFMATPELIKFAQNPVNNLELIEVEDTPDEPIDTKTEEPSTTVTGGDASPTLPLGDSNDDGFADPPPKKD